MSIKTYLLPTEIFFDKILANNWAVESMFAIFSILIILSSTEANPNAPPQTKHPPVFRIISFISFTEKLTLAIVSITSAVPAALVIALDDVFGITNPAVVQML